jgi:hypothetical protein
MLLLLLYIGLGVCPPEVGCYKTFKNGQWVCERCGC